MIEIHAKARILHMCCNFNKGLGHAKARILHMCCNFNKGLGQSLNKINLKNERVRRWMLFFG